MWGIDGIVLRPSLFTLPVPLVVFIESALVTLILTPLIFFRKSELKQLKTKDWLSFAGVALFGGAMGTMAITKALFYVHFVNLSIVVLIQKLQPAFALLFAALFLREKLPPRFFLWSGIAMLGAYLMTFGFIPAAIETGEASLYSVLFALLAAVSFALSTVLSKRALRNTGYETGTYLRFLFAAFILLVLNLYTGDFSSIDSVTSHQVIIFVIIAFSTGGLAIILYYYGLKKITASVASICELAFPLTAVALEYFLRGNILKPDQWLGVILLIIGMLKVTGFRKAPVIKV